MQEPKLALKYFQEYKSAQHEGHNSRDILYDIFSRGHRCAVTHIDTNQKDFQLALCICMSCTEN